jgi:hypothetical protein
VFSTILAHIAQNEAVVNDSSPKLPYVSSNLFYLNYNSLSHQVDGRRVTRCFLRDQQCPTLEIACKLGLEERKASNERVARGLEEMCPTVVVNFTFAKK